MYLWFSDEFYLIFQDFKRKFSKKKKSGLNCSTTSLHGTFFLEIASVHYIKIVFTYCMCKNN